MLCGCFFTAWMGQFAHQLKDVCDWRIVALTRSGLAFVFAVGLARACGARLVLWRPRALWLRGCASSVSLLCTFFALTQLPTSEVMTLTNTFPIWVAFLSWPLLGTPPSASVWLAAACGVFGVTLIQSPHFQVDVQATSAVALSLLAALTWAVVVHYSGVATVFVFASWFVSSTPALSPLADGKTLALLLGVGAAATLGQLCVTRAFTSGQPVRVSVVGLTQILFALGLDLMFEGPSFRPAALAGIVLILLPTAWVMIGKAREHQPASPILSSRTARFAWNVRTASDLPHGVKNH
jgi:drug/metabolite transporter (DMT)-like permease